jgi:hypothetical protein
MTCVEEAETSLIQENARGSFCLPTPTVLNVTDGFYWSHDLRDNILEQSGALRADPSGRAV